MGLCRKAKGLLGRLKKTPDGGSKGGGGASSPSATPTTNPPPEQIVLSVPHLPKPPPASPSPEPPSASDAASSPSHDDPWSRAYKIFEERESELMADYKKHLASLQGDIAASADLSTPRSVKSIVKQLLEDRDKKQWQVPLLGKDIKIREQAERLAKFFLWSDPIVKNTLSAQPYAQLAWSGVSLLLPLLTSGTTQNEAMLKGFNSIGDVQVYWTICEETYLRSPHQRHYQDLIEPLAKLYSHIIEYQARVICHLSKAQLSRAWEDLAGYDWAGKATEIDKWSKECTGCIVHFNEEEIRERWNCQLQEMQQSRSILDEICRILEEGGKQTRRIYEDQEEGKLLEHLASDYEGYKNFNPQKVKGTCEWFFNDDKFHKWRDSNTSSLLWVSAGPGCGKSVLSRALIDERRLSTNVTTSTVCHFFFKDGDERRMYSTNALCAILHQLFTHDPTGSLIGNALPSHKNYGEKLTQNFSELWRILLQCATSPDGGEIICILDALDECNADGRRQLIDRLKEFYFKQDEMSSSPSKLKLLITSRPYDDLETSFEKFSGAAAYLRFDGDDKSKQISQEINLVTDARVRDIAGRFTANDQRRISERLKSMENRTYLWLHLTFDIIEQKKSLYSRLHDIERLLSDLPTEVSEAYEKILSQSQDETRTEILLRIVLAAARPLTLDEANVALALALEDQRLDSYAALELFPRDSFESTVKNLCGLFISISDSTLSLIHQTAREFLINSKRQGKWEGRLNMPKSHSTMSLACLRYLLLPDLATSDEGSISDGDSASEDSPDDKQRSFPSYAAAHWPLHHISQEDVIADQSRKDARILCNVAGKQARVWAPNYFEWYLHWERWTDLALASYLGLKLVVEDILAKEKTDVNAQGGYYGPALQAASRQGHGEVVQILLDKGADINAQGRIHRTALQAASEGGHREIVQILLDKGADINAQDRVHGTALQVASAGGHREIVQMLLDKGADVNTRGGGDGTALQAASRQGHREVVQMLLDKGADVNTQDGVYGTALQTASHQGHGEVVQMLLDKGADVNTQDRVDCTALQAASAGGHRKIVRMLLDKGANINAQGRVHGTALQVASAGGHGEVVQMLLDYYIK